MPVQVLLGIVGLYLAYCGLLFVLQRTILFPRFLIATPSGVAETVPGLETMWLETNGGRVEAWFLPPALDRRKGPAPAVIFAHGNAELIDFWPRELSPFTGLGMGLLLVEYPGYGRSEGTPSQQSITETLSLAYDALVAREDVDASRIVLFGRSLGGGAVCALAAHRPSAALILLSTFTSVASMASTFLVPRLFVREPFDNLAVVDSYPYPVLVIHGKHDDLVPYRHGTALVRAAQRGTMITYDCRHNDCPPQWDRFWKDMEEFLRRAGVLADPR